MDTSTTSVSIIPARLQRITQQWRELVEQVWKWAVVRVLRVGGVPRHVAFVMDGNRRWARGKGWRVGRGHEGGFEVLKEVSGGGERSEKESFERSESFRAERVSFERSEHQYPRFSRAERESVRAQRASTSSERSENLCLAPQATSPEDYPESGVGRSSISISVSSRPS
jgi:hypothetical protein